MNQVQQLPPDEPLLDVDDIQGNILPGFMKPHMRLVSLTIGKAPGARRFIRDLKLTSLATVMTSRELVRRERGLRPSLRQVGATPPTVDDVWWNLGISHAGLKRLNVLGADDFEDPAFKLGLAARSSALGDPTEEKSKGHPSSWVVGGPQTEVHLLVVIGADHKRRIDAAVQELTERASEHDLQVVRVDQGAKFDARGSEHFGFQDGISQPGVRGRTGLHDFLSYRLIDPAETPDTWLHGLPGQLLIWPGEFVFGYPGASADPLVPGEVLRPGPEWSANGSYLVYRRLRQDVGGFYGFLDDQAATLRRSAGFEDWSAERLGAALVGRWRSGAPLLRAPLEDNEELGVDRMANNSFGYAKDAGPVATTSGQDSGGAWPGAPADPVGLLCPQAAHIRKVNTRETPNDLGASRAGLDRRILRRGIPYGKPWDPDKKETRAVDRGLLFVSYQTSIERQFEFLNTRWMSSPVNPRGPSGHDMVVGQNGQPGQGRERSCVLFGSGHEQATVSTAKDFVLPTGGGYFFSPSISAVRDVLAASPRRRAPT